MANRTLSLILLTLGALGCRDKEADTGDSLLVGPEDTAPDEDIDNTFEICEDQTWSGQVVIGSVYYVCSTATLTLSPGTVVSFKPGSGLVVDGVLKADGNADSPITFQSHYGVSGGNDGLSIGGVGDLSSLSYAEFHSIDLRMEGGAMGALSYVAFTDSTLGIYSRETAFVVDSVTFSDNQREDQSALIARDLPSLSVSNASFSKVNVGILFDGVQDDASLTVQTVTFTDNRNAIVVGTVGKYKHTVNIDNVDVLDTTGDALLFNNAVVSLSNATITDTYGYGVWGDLSSDLSLDTVDLTGTGNVAVYAVGSLTMNEVSVSGSESAGIYAGETGSTLSGVTVDNVKGYGIYSTGDLSIDYAEVSDATSTAIYALRGDLTLTNSSVHDILGSGAYAAFGDLVVRDSLLERLEAHGLYVSTASATVSDVTIRDVRNNAIYAYRSSLVVEPGTTGVLIEDVDGYGLYASEETLVAQNVTMNRIRSHGIYGYFSSVTVSDIHITEVIGTGIYAYRADMVVTAGETGVTVDDGETYGLYSNTGNMDAEGFTITGTRSTAVYVAYGDMKVRDASVSDAGGYGLYVSKGNADVVGVTVSETVSTGIAVSRGDAVVSSVVVDDSGGSGVSVSEGELTLSDATISGTTDYGIYAAFDNPDTTKSCSVKSVTLDNTNATAIASVRCDLTLEDATITDSGNVGVYVSEADADISQLSINEADSVGVQVATGDLVLKVATIGNVGGDGVYVSDGNAQIEDLEVIDLSSAQDQSAAAGGGIDVRGHAQVSGARIEKVESYGLYADSAEVTYSSFSEGLEAGIYIYGSDASTIAYTDVTDNDSYGVRSVSSGNDVQISDSNITGNTEYGLYYLELADGCYVANNKLLTAVDTTKGGTVDGSFDVKGTQVYYIDSVTNPSSASISGTGP